MYRIVHTLTHWGRVMHICVSKLTIIGSDNGLLPNWHQAIIWTNAGLLLIGPLGTNLSEILIEILTFSFKKMRLKVLSVKRRPFCLGLNELMILKNDGIIWKCYLCSRPFVKGIHCPEMWRFNNLFLAATKQLYDWFSPSVRPSVCLSVRPSVCHTFFTMFPSSYHHVIFRSYYHGQKWWPCKRSRSEVKGHGHRGQHPT